MKRLAGRWIVLLLCALGAATEAAVKLRVKRIVGGTEAEPPPEQELYRRPLLPPPPPPDESESSKTAQNVSRKDVFLYGVADGEVYSFLGIRYAEPPVGELRFQRPKRLKLKGEIQASKYAPPCPQPNPDNDGWIGNEDCLFLNVHTPPVPNKSEKMPKYPVLFWIHGGNFRRGSAAQYDPKHLVERGVVVVTVQYRLGSLGFLSTGRTELPGNVGLFDITAALRWVKDYIVYFYGDPNRIIAAGQGSGASCASMLAFNKLTNATLSGIFAMSGSPVSPFSVDKMERETAGEVSVADGCKMEEGVDFVRCMQELPLETIMEGDNRVQDSKMAESGFPRNLAGLQGPGPAEEGSEDDRFLPYFILEPPLIAAKRGDFPRIPLLNGVTKEETSNGVKGNFLTDVTNKLLKPSFLKNGLFNDLLVANTGLYPNKSVDPQLRSLFLNNNYLDFFTKVITSALSELEKVIKHTTDAFFNLPAFVTSHLWSQRSKVYLYSFEHIPTKSIAGELLSGLPLVSVKNKNPLDKSGPAHGDDLRYLFNIRSLLGAPLNNAMDNPSDVKVRDHFTYIVAEFARTGVPKVKGGPDWKPFKASEGNYMIIKERPETGKNFRKCQMGLWTGDTGLLGSPECGFLGAAVETVTGTVGSAGSTLLRGVTSPVDTFASAVSGISQNLQPLAQPFDTGLSPIGGLFPGPLRPQPTTTTRKPSSGGGLLGFGGILG